MTQSVPDEFSSVPLFTFKTLKNTALGALRIERDEDGSVVLTGILKLVTESMLQSYPRSVLGKWTPNRARVRYSAEEAEGRDWKGFESGEALDVEGVLAL